jgi:hypothetical protein
MRQLPRHILPALQVIPEEHPLAFWYLHSTVEHRYVITDACVFKRPVIEQQINKYDK